MASLSGFHIHLNLQPDKESTKNSCFMQMLIRKKISLENLFARRLKTGYCLKQVSAYFGLIVCYLNSDVFRCKDVLVVVSMKQR